MPIKKYDTATDAMKAIAVIDVRTLVITLNDDFKITIQSLGAKDETDTFVECMNYWGQAFLYRHKIETISRAIIKVNDQSVEDLALDTKKELIGRWSQTLVDRIYTEYAGLIGSVDAFIDKIKLTAQTNVVGVREAEKKEKEEKTDANEERKDESAE